jgi:general stress protein 26
MHVSWTDTYPLLADFLQSQPAATMAVPIDDGGTPHIASLLYWHTPNPLKFYFVTSKQSEKAKQLATHQQISAAAVVGTVKDTPFTLQMRGQLKIIDPLKHQMPVEQYYRKRGNRKDDLADPSNCLLEFTPTWARFTDYSLGYAQTQLTLT